MIPVLKEVIFVCRMKCKGFPKKTGIVLKLFRPKKEKKLILYDLPVLPKSLSQGKIRTRPYSAAVAPSLFVQVVAQCPSSVAPVEPRRRWEAEHTQRTQPPEFGVTPAHFVSGRGIPMGGGGAWYAGQTSAAPPASGRTHIPRSPAGADRHSSSAVASCCTLVVGSLAGACSWWGRWPARWSQGTTPRGPMRSECRTQASGSTRFSQRVR